MTTAKRSWKAMKTRCTNKNQDTWEHYGGRGITFCSSWESFDVFLRDMGEPPSVGHSLERIDNDGGYTPENCRWATASEQANNKRNNRLLTVDGETKTLSQWAKEYGVNVTTLFVRIDRGWNEKDAVTTPVTKNNNRRYRMYKYSGRTMPLREIARINNINYSTLWRRIKRGATLNEALNMSSELLRSGYRHG